jgi:ABC-type antimicrobial peptide transport system permease subunit
MTWQKMLPEMVQIIQSDRVGGIFMIAILYMIIAFGIFGTVLMMTEERKKEFSVMVAIGMQKSKLVLVTLYETILMNAIGIAIGIAIALPLVFYFNLNPIEMTGAEAESMAKLGVEPVLPTLISFEIFLNQIIIILIITGIAAIYPAFSIFKMKVLKSLRR